MTPKKIAKIEEHEVTWDSRPQFQIWEGVQREFFRKGNLAAALHRQIGTIRALEKKGVLFTPSLKSPHNQWLYTRSQIEDLVQLFKEEGVLDPTTRPRYSDHLVAEAYTILKRLP